MEGMERMDRPCRKQEEGVYTRWEEKRKIKAMSSTFDTFDRHCGDEIFETIFEVAS